jgi:CheY-like chemotaxis protein
MKHDLFFLTESSLSFKLPPRACRTTAPEHERRKLLRTLKRNLPARLPSEGEIVASFGGAALFRHRDGRWELRGGSPGDHSAAREWCSHFQPEATFQSAPLPIASPREKSTNSARNRILIADDDALVRGSLAALLESEGYVVDEAENGNEAVRRAVAHTPDLVLLDLNMPEWDGWTAFSQLDRVRPLLPVIVITARPNQYPKAVQLGVDAFMEKPLNIPILMRAITRLTSEEDDRHVRRITNTAFVTQLLGSTGS